MAPGTLHGWRRHDALHQARLLPQDHAALLAASLGVGLPERCLRNCIGRVAPCSTVLTIRRLGLHRLVDRSLPGEHQRLPEPGRSTRTADPSFPAPALARRVHSVGVLAHKARRGKRTMKKGDSRRRADPCGTKNAQVRESDIDTKKRNRLCSRIAGRLDRWHLGNVEWQAIQ